MATLDTDLTVNQPTAKPTAKVTAGVVGGAVATLVTFTLNAWLGIEFPAGVEAAIATLVGFFVSYATPERVQGVEG